MKRTIFVVYTKEGMHSTHTTVDDAHLVYQYLVQDCKRDARLDKCVVTPILSTINWNIYGSEGEEDNDV